ncbi:uncharacterized protein LOC122505521 [Leptopilina heterotoma]|uniref:uncharacterized protein LOC122505521 n=1 Tax=Leptopilina heterotoma TaxID=63436 RepID=UPI001CA87476|nr:uncharacterized protein LOC122505521 [Leptopilina heterotoma]
MYPDDICVVTGAYNEIDLTNNLIYKFPIFDNEIYNTAVTKLILSDNRISNFHGISFYNNLQTLELNRNRVLLNLTDEDLIELQSLKKLTKIYLHKSHFMCNDNFNQLLNHKISASIQQFRELSCVDPSTRELNFPFSTL